MKILSTLSLAVLGLSVTTHAAHAQASVYGLVGLANYGTYSYSDESSFDYPSASDGIGGGFTYIFYNHGVSIGVDLRDVYTPNLGQNTGNSHTANTAAFTAHLGFVGPEHPCHPYFQIGPGIISDTVAFTNGGYPARTINTGAISVDGGLDVRINPFIDVRAVDLQITVGGSGTNAAESVFFGAGVVVHFPHTR